MCRRQWYGCEVGRHRTTFIGYQQENHQNDFGHLPANSRQRLYLEAEARENFRRQHPRQCIWLTEEVVRWETECPRCRAGRLRWERDQEKKDRDRRDRDKRDDDEGRRRQGSEEGLMNKMRALFSGSSR